MPDAWLCIFAAAFSLPACRDSESTDVLTNTYPGWKCAQVTISAAFEKDSYESPSVLAVVSGLINPLILIYLPLSFFTQFTRVRRVLAAVVVVCMAATWAFFWIAHLVPLIGHFMWIAGALMILAGEVAGRPRQA